MGEEVRPETERGMAGGETTGPSDSGEDASRPLELSTGTIVTGREPASNPPPILKPTITDFPAEVTASGQYADVRELGRGGMGVVYLAHNLMMGRLEVLKIVNKSLLDWPGAVERFLREIRSAAKLRHPNVVTAYSAQQFGNIVVFAMEYVEGTDLNKLLKAKGPLPVPNACYYIFQAALGLQHAHEKEMVHRDIKPSNLILAREGKKQVVKVLDFGLAKGTGETSIEDSLSGAGKVMLCTPDYVAPEQIRDTSRADIRSDIYSLGCTLYNLLSGRMPFVGKTVYDVLSAHRSVKATPLADLRADIPFGLSSMVAKLMAKDPAHRFQTPAEVAAALRPYFRPGIDAEVVVSSIVLTPIAGVEVAAEEPKRLARSTQAIADDTTPTVRRRPRRGGRKKGRPLSTTVLVARFAAGALVLTLFIAWAAGAFKSRVRDTAPDNTPGRPASGRVGQ